MDNPNSTNGQAQHSQDHISTLEEPKRILENNEKQIFRLRHPIRDCPEDILRIIFDYTTQSHSDKLGLFREATAISHVCKLWRAVILRMRSLWKSISISMKDSIEDTTLFVERTRTRLGTTPIDIAIEDIGNYPIVSMKGMMESVELHKFTAISNLKYHITAPDSLVHLTTLIQRSTAASVDGIEIIQGSKSERPPNWGGTPILAHFPSLKSLLLDVDVNIRFDTPETYTTLSILKVGGSKSLRYGSVSPQILRFPGLRELRMGSMGGWLNDLSEDIIMPQLCDLSLAGSGTFPWSKVSAPCLRRIVITRGDSEETIKFFSRHPLISSLNCWIDCSGEQFERFARCLVNLEVLTVQDRCDALYKEIHSRVPFPRLKKLVSFPLPRISAFEFETFIRARFLSQGTHNVATLTHWTFVDGERYLENASWRRSALIDQLQVTKERINNWLWKVTLTLK